MYELTAIIICFPVIIGLYVLYRTAVEVSDQRSAYAELFKVVKEVHCEHSDDLCWMPADVNKIFVAAGLPPQDLRIGDPAAMLKNCERYVGCLQVGGPWKSYADLEAELTRIAEIAERMRIAIEQHDRSEIEIEACNLVKEVLP